MYHFCRSYSLLCLNILDPFSCYSHRYPLETVSSVISTMCDTLHLSENTAAATALLITWPPLYTGICINEVSNYMYVYYVFYLS